MREHRVAVLRAQRLLEEAMRVLHLCCGAIKVAERGVRHPPTDQDARDTDFVASVSGATTP